MVRLVWALTALENSFVKVQLKEKYRDRPVDKTCTIDDLLKEETLKNQKEFESFQEKLEKQYGAGRNILMREQQFVADFDTKRDALTAGNLLYPDKLFSIHTIEKFNEKIFSHFP